LSSLSPVLSIISEEFALNFLKSRLRKLGIGCLGKVSWKVWCGTWRRGGDSEIGDVRVWDFWGGMVGGEKEGREEGRKEGREGGRKEGRKGGS